MAMPTHPRTAPGPFRAEQFHDGDPYELSDGHAIRCLPGGLRHGSAQIEGGRVLASDPAARGRVGVEVGVAFNDDKNLRAPDVIVADVEPAPGWLRSVPPLALEYADTGQDETELAAKISELHTGGTRYVPGGLLSFFFEQVQCGVAYKFRVAAFNEKGQGAYSAWSNAVIPLNFDEVPTGSLDPKNTVNPIYNAGDPATADLPNRGEGLGPGKLALEGRERIGPQALEAQRRVVVDAIVQHLVAQAVEQSDAFLAVVGDGVRADVVAVAAPLDQHAHLEVAERVVRIARLRRAQRE
jgi:hypothetical protein